MTLQQAIISALADNFGCTSEDVERWIVKHGYTLPAYLRRHGLHEYAEAVEEEAAKVISAPALPAFRTVTP